ncbi:MAG: anti-sigma regulatory factor [Actinomycetia bacterium]|nr:anti-sigma regulatory factor [Actinomycetes bacterium]
MFEAVRSTIDDTGLDLRVGQRINDRRDVAGLRRRIRDALSDSWVEDRVDAVTLAATELAANGLVHGKQPVLFRLFTGPERVLITVFDSGDTMPYFDPDQPPELLAAAGRGLRLVRSAAERSGTASAPNGGKWVFAEWRRAPGDEPVP